MDNLENMQAADMASTAKIVYNSPNVVCECGSKVFHEAMVLKRVSSLVTGSGREELVPIPVYVCDKCGKIPAEFTNKPAAKLILGEDKSEEKETVIIK